MIIVDSGFWFGLFDRKDSNHQVCKAFLAQCREPLITTFPVLTEALHLLMRRENVRLAFDFLTLLQTLQHQGNFSTFPLTDGHLSRLTNLMVQYADLPMDLADASLVLLAEELGHGRIVSTDKRDFHTYRWKNHQPFTNLLEQIL
ncbi:type II toxin-antitoxin system VapC family toxin [Crenothrix polyspora]|uniref:Ribonuclease VapC n=1 Tax=Crenothrix polyspora TaxID=360316 RepID=A0A1R4HDP0_9GAMM|nr:PIN domain-containing protein [Crenothrix polyspora]SJM94352.1 PilT protein domain protein [Crenothrix polyspora]